MFPKFALTILSTILFTSLVIQPVFAVTSSPYQTEPASPMVSDTGCVIGGCSGELCTDMSLGPQNSICLYKEEYACFKFAVCERQESGQCGWSETPESLNCRQGMTPTSQPQPEPTTTSTPNASPTCIPRPACLDAKIPCDIPEPVDGAWCPPTTPTITATPSSEVIYPTHTPTVTPTTIPTPSTTPTWGPLSQPLKTFIPQASHNIFVHLKALLSPFRFNFILWQD